MKRYPDKFFELAIVDPPYNVGASDGTFGNKGKYVRKDLKHYGNHNITPDKEYFAELMRVSKNQIVWGFNYYPEFFTHSGCIIWDKMKPENTPLSDCEIAWHSIDKVVKIYRHQWFGFCKGSENGKGGERIHPNQKPVKLYKWLLTNYAKEGDKILDTHLGSGSIALACHTLKFDLVGFEIDKDYFDAATKRLKDFQMQGELF